MSENALLFIHALTGVHPGSGTALGAVDLPVQRERHTQWPIVPASSLKGILRDACRRKKRESDDELLAVFGPPTDRAHLHAGALSLTDARVLAFPVRSLRGVFAWVTCPSLLERLVRDLQVARLEPIAQPPRPRKDEVACAKDSPLLVENGEKMVLEEFEFARVDGMEVEGVTDWIASQAVRDPATSARIRERLAILHDDDFTHFVRYATEVVARVGLDHERKTVRKGALFYEEFLPAETLFYSLVFCEDSRREGNGMDAREVLAFLRESLPPVLQIGAGETIGRGVCAVRLWPEKEGDRHGSEGLHPYARAAQGEERMAGRP